MIQKLQKKGVAFLLFVCFLSFSIPVYGAEKRELYVNARSAIAMDSESKMILFEQNAYDLIPIASTTKIMTTLVALTYGDLNKEIEISSKAASIHGSEVGYKKGEKVTLRELLYGLMLRSGNDAAIAIAEGMCGSVEAFLELMNEYALEIGLLNSHFESPHGLDSQNHYSTAYDLALVTSKAKEIKTFNEIVSAKDVDGAAHHFTRSYHNINKILYQLPNANGVKTGYTGGAGKCLVSSVNHEGRDIIIVTLNCTPRWKETTRIYEYVAKNYEYQKIFGKEEVLGTVPVANEKNPATLISSKEIVLPVKKGENLQTKICKPKFTLQGPLKKGQEVGCVEVYKQNKFLISTPLVVKEAVGKERKAQRKTHKWNPLQWFCK